MTAFEDVKTEKTISSNSSCLITLVLSDCLAVGGGPPNDSEQLS